MSNFDSRKFNRDLIEHRDPRVEKVLKKLISPRFLIRSESIWDVPPGILIGLVNEIENKFCGKNWEDLREVDKFVFEDEETFDFIMTSELEKDCLMYHPADYKDWWDDTVDELFNYVKKNNLKTLVLGISGGLDSAVCAAIAWKVSKLIGIRSIGISLPIVNTSGEITSADLTGNAWYSPKDYITIPLSEAYKAIREVLVRAEEENPGLGAQTKIADGNIMARLRMITLYNFAGINKGMVLSTGNKTENLLGFFTIHGDEPMDYNLLDDLYKTEVYRLARWIRDNIAETDEQKKALQTAIDITPTDGLGISSSDLEQIGAESYYQVDRILEKETERVRTDISDIPEEIVEKVLGRVKASEFKQRFIL